MKSAIKFGLLLNPSRSIYAEIERAKKLGFDFVEIPFEPPLMWREIRSEANRVKDYIETRELFVITHAPWWLDLATDFEPVRKAWLKVVMEMLTISKKLGARAFGLHTRCFDIFNSQERREVLFTNLIESLRAILSRARKAKMKIHIENCGERESFHKLRWLERLAQELPDIGLHVDIGHAFVFNKRSQVFAFIERYYDRITHFHFHDNNMKEDQHLAIGEGKIPFKRICNLLRKLDWSGTISFEVFRSDKLVKRSLLKIKKYLKVE